MPSKFKYREAVIEDADAISTLILRSQEKYTFHEYSEDGRKFMHRLCSADSIREYINRGDIYFVAEHESNIVGVIGIRNARHIAHNFVDDLWFERGISTHLWELARAACIDKGNSTGFDLRASTYAIRVYKNWGFVQLGPSEDTGGIISTPMHLKIDQE